MPALVVDFSEARQIFALPDWVLEAIRATLPGDWELRALSGGTSGRGDGGGSASPETLAAVADAEVYLGFGIPAEVIRGGPALRWVHSGTAGVGSSLTPEMLDSDVVFTNSAGVHAVPMAESVIGMLLHFARGFDVALEAQRESRWDTTRFDAADAPVRELGGTTVGVIGYGGIGREVARRALALGCRVLATRRRPELGAEPGVELVTGDDALLRLLSESDHVVLTAPKTASTEGMIGAAELERMRHGAVLVNVARGGLVDEAALVEALERGRLRGAGLDVFAAEPLPPESPLWRRPDVLITPHVSPYTHRFWEREAALVTDNLRRWLNGRPLLNVVNKQAGY